MILAQRKSRSEPNLRRAETEHFDRLTDSSKKLNTLAIFLSFYLNFNCNYIIKIFK